MAAQNDFGESGFAADTGRGGRRCGSLIERESLGKPRANLEMTKRLCEFAPDRLSAFARVNPLHFGMVDLARRALTYMAFAGIKIIPDHWYVHEGRLEPFWEAMNELGASILFHTGILYGFEDGSRFCKPLYLEELVHYPNIRFAMAHIWWPWCDECLAVMGRMRNVASISNACKGVKSSVEPILLERTARILESAVNGFGFLLQCGCRCNRLGVGFGLVSSAGGGV